MQNNQNNHLKTSHIHKKFAIRPIRDPGDTFASRYFLEGSHSMNRSNDTFFLYKINNVITERKLLQPDQRILIAVSGGQDSICLLRVLFHLKKKWNWKLGIIHCDHRWDHNSKFQAKHVACLAVKLQIDYYQGITLESVQKEGIARSWRYDTIQIIAASSKYTAVITGHTASDRIETLLYNLTRGSGLQGLQAIRWKRYFSSSRFVQSAVSKTKSTLLFKEIKYKKTFECFSFFKTRKKLHLIRPLLETTRTEIGKVLTVWNFPLWSDRSNKELQISRNRIRHRLIPYLRIHYNLNIDQTLARWAEIVHSETLYLELLTNFLLSKIEIKKQQAGLLRIRKKVPSDKDFNFVQSAISIDLLCSLPLALQRRILKQYVYKITGRVLGFHYVEQIRLSCFFHSSLSSTAPIWSLDPGWNENLTVKKKNHLPPWLLFPGGIKLLIRKGYIFLFYPIF